MKTKFISENQFACEMIDPEHCWIELDGQKFVLEYDALLEILMKTAAMGECMERLQALPLNEISETANH